MTRRDKCLWILVPLIGDFVAQRGWLHGVGISHVRLGGHLIHHLFFGILLLVPAALSLAFEPGPRRLRASLAMLGLSMGMIADEFYYLVFTAADDAAYLASFGPALASILLCAAVVMLISQAPAE